ncbi:MULTISPECIES: HEAT repeat domain-containing protein [Nitrospirillum]|uniref:HEAT repeat protein n=1 Tax=Nitrospirillum amazonense TaxID=28077 RepID=A0A560EXN0_9PROT|nr:HEAT repeat domain-containing protein [Nitrospirillum amazonense]MEC4593399.1 HEAT repeat domain-containing protein [Nitrospirillum amazonense]TWB14114.1 HEAT repeat protein [Nitrospirillum amazonense]
MAKDYMPPSDFLRDLIDEDVEIEADDTATVKRLLSFFKDPDAANRDWAVFLLGQSEVDTKAVRDALVQALDDEDDSVRAEALVALAQRDGDLARPHVLEALSAEGVYPTVFEAAALCAHPDLIKPLRGWLKATGDKEVDQMVAEAVAACEASAK